MSHRFQALSIDRASAEAVALDPDASSPRSIVDARGMRTFTSFVAAALGLLYAGLAPAAAAEHSTRQAGTRSFDARHTSASVTGTTPLI